MLETLGDSRSHLRSHSQLRHHLRSRLRLRSHSRLRLREHATCESQNDSQNEFPNMRTPNKHNHLKSDLI